MHHEPRVLPSVLLGVLLALLVVVCGYVYYRLGIEP
jgi:hypothetical protein